MRLLFDHDMKVLGLEKIAQELLLYTLDYYQIDQSIRRHIVVDFHIDHESDNCGTCIQEDDLQFKIILNPNTEDMEHTKSVLFHEFVHVKQYILGELEETDQKEIYWKSMNYTSYDIDANYERLPWEVEAFYMEQVLMEKYND